MKDSEVGAQQPLEQLASRVLAEVETYTYDYSAGTIGRPLRQEKVQAYLDALRAALVAPYWADIKRRDTVEQIKMTDPPVSRCAIVADDTRGTLLAFDPTSGEFLLVMPFKDALESFGVSGDAVGCFMAR